VSAQSIRRWALLAPVRDGIGGLVPVHVVAEGAAKTLTVCSPTGCRVEGLSTTLSVSRAWQMP